MSRFAKGNEIIDNCGCKYKVLKVGRKYYHLLDTDKFKFMEEIKELDKRAILEGDKGRVATMSNALKVIAYDRCISKWLKKNDPMALEQVIKAIQE